MNVTAIVDLQFGSTGKGLLAGYLSLNNDYEAVISANMPNAGHTFVAEDGTKWVHKVLPSGVYSKELKYIMVGPGAVFDIDRLTKEIAGLRTQGVTAEVVVHENAAILKPQHALDEQAKLNSIASTMQGSMEAMYEKMQREGTAVMANIAKNYVGEIMAAGAVVWSNSMWIVTLADFKEVLVEGSQGYSLGINAGFYPYCTSRDCTVWRLLADCAVPYVAQKGMLKVVGSARVHPIRVGNTQKGYSGPSYPDQKELTWEQLGQTPETTTVTGRVRRVFSFSEQQIREAILASNVSEVFLNFCNYDPPEAVRVIQAINQIGRLNVEDPFFAEHDIVRYIGCGPKASHVLKLGGYHG